MVDRPDPGWPERPELADLLAALGPAAPTLCTGWTTQDLAAHLVARERRPLATPGLLVPALAGYTERVRRRIATRPYPELVAMVRTPPAWSPTRLGPVERAINGLELFVHHEDVRRAQPDWQPRSLPAGVHRLLWSRLRPLLRLRLRRFPATLLVRAPGHGELRIGAGGDGVWLTADPGELVVFGTGRQAAARVELTGPAALVDRLRTARLGL